MKNVILAVVIAIASSVALANTKVVCTTGADTNFGYVVKLNGPSEGRVETATVIQFSSLSQDVVAELACGEPEGEVHPDAIFTTRCVEPELADGGYSVVREVGGFAGFNHVKLYEVTFAGSNLLATLPCRSVNPR